MTNEKVGGGPSERGAADGRNSDSWVDAHLEAWLKHAAKRRYSEIDPEHLQRLERQFIESGRTEGLFANRRASFLERLRAAIFGAGSGSPTEAMVTGRGQGRGWVCWLSVTLVILALGVGAWWLWLSGG